MSLSYRELTQPNAEPVSLATAKHHLRVDFPDDDAYITGLITAARQYVEKYTNRCIFNRTILLTLDYFPWPGWSSTTGSSDGTYYLKSYFRGVTIRLPKPSLVSVESVTYIANDGVTLITIDPTNYVVDTNSEPARIAPKPGYTWPYQQNYLPGQVRVTYTAGTYEQATTATITVPSTAPYTVTLPNAANIVTFTNVTDNSGNPVTCTNTGGTLTFDAGHAGATLTANYTINLCPQTITSAMLLIIGHLYEHRSENTELSLKALPMGVEYLLAGEVFESWDWS